MTKKYEFTGEIKSSFGTIVKRIRRLSDGCVGGWIEYEANLSQDGLCFVSDEAQVFGKARVFGNARVYGNAVVYDYATVFGNALVNDNAKVYHDAKVFDDAYVCDNAKVYGDAIICKDAKVCGNVRVFDKDQVFDKNGWCTWKWDVNDADTQLTKEKENTGMTPIKLLKQLFQYSDSITDYDIVVDVYRDFVAMQKELEMLQEMAQNNGAYTFKTTIKTYETEE